MKRKKIITFEEQVRELEKEEFPEFKENDIYCPPNNSYMYFSPRWHLRSELWTKEIAEDLKNNKMILSVGSGQAYLERFLVKYLGVKSEQIVLSDKDLVMPNGFKQYRFDMYEQWPNFTCEFNYVIFPESVLLNCRFTDNINKQKGLYHLLEEALKATRANGQIRISGHSQNPDNIDIVKGKLSRTHLDLKLSYDRGLIVVNKG